MSATLPNVLLSTTRMWNCGDDFIAFGVTELLRKLLPRFNPIASRMTMQSMRH